MHILMALTVILAVVAGVAWTRHSVRSFETMVQGDVTALAHVAETRPPATQSARSLPEPAARYLSRALPCGPHSRGLVSMEQEGFFRLKPDQGWLPMVAHAWWTVHQPGLVWHGRIELSKIAWATGRDKLIAGEAGMIIRMWSAYTVARMSGPEVAQSDLMRWLTEAVWFPAALAPGGCIRWEEHGPDSAVAVVESGTLAGRAVFFFDEHGNPLRAECERLREEGGRQVPRPFTAMYGPMRERDGILAPKTGEAIWDLPEGRFAYARIRAGHTTYGAGKPAP
ncbi:MAG: DUF6544 family protein [Desulfatibacillaceae bacterium]